MSTAKHSGRLSSIGRTPGISGCKDIDSRFVHANSEFKQLVGLAQSTDIRGLTKADFPCDLANDANTFRHQDICIIERRISISTLNFYRFSGSTLRAFLVVKKPWVTERSTTVRGVLFDGFEINVMNAGSLATQSGRLLAKHASIGCLSQGSFVIADSESHIEMTHREKEVLYFLLRGGTAKRIGQVLSISSRTVEQYIDVLKDKFNARTKSELTEKAITSGYLYIIPDAVQGMNFPANHRELSLDKKLRNSSEAKRLLARAI